MFEEIKDTAEIDAQVKNNNSLAGYLQQSLAVICNDNKLISAYNRLKCYHIIDLLYHLPHSFIDRRYSPELWQYLDGVVASFKVKVISHKPPPSNASKNPTQGKAPYRILCENNSGTLTLVYFKAKPAWMHKILPIGEVRIVSGKVENYNGQNQIAHPDFVVHPDDKNKVWKNEAQYSMVAGINNQQINKDIDRIFADIDEILAANKVGIVAGEWINKRYLDSHGWHGWYDSLKIAHGRAEGAQSLEEGYLPSAQEQQLFGHNIGHNIGHNVEYHWEGDNEHQISADGLEVKHQKNAVKRLAYDELFAHQLALLIMRQNFTKQPAEKLPVTGALRKVLLEEIIPFKLTKSQQDAIDEINKDISSGYRMYRLLQGDVGSGKTLVGMMAIFAAIEAGKQAVLMAPTEILAKQHYEYFMENYKKLCDFQKLNPQKLNSEHEFSKIKLREPLLLTGNDRGKGRDFLIMRIMSGEAQIIIGTHALFSDDVVYKDLAMIVIDEQHRFGVAQREMLEKKSRYGHVLMMSATPIPRSLTMALCGDMACSKMMDKPAGRKPITTRIMSLDRVNELLQRIKHNIEQHQTQIYWICPLVEESELLDLTAAEQRYHQLQDYFGEQVGLVHGKMKPNEKEQVMNRFSNGELAILIATTVIEVGVNVPNATIMIIEHAQRFGLAQLHQLRGRVGRGDKESSCILLYGDRLSNNGRARLDIMRSSEDGFEIAERDLQIRGAGDILGDKQSGLPDFYVADLQKHSDLLAAARHDAMILLEQDNSFSLSDRGRAANELLKLFSY